MCMYANVNKTEKSSEKKVAQFVSIFKHNKHHFEVIIFIVPYRKFSLLHNATKIITISQKLTLL